jgi:glucosamine 6-phosphate synthetase-like amidotransferase/phosphosugar isomerase protein
VNGERQLSCLRAEGKPEERNAHPHLDGPGRVAVVQNGIIENDRTLPIRIRR